MKGKLKSKMSSLKSKLKNNKGGLAQLMVVVLLVIITTYIFTAAIHPSSNVIKGAGQSAGQGIITEQSSINTDFQPVPMSAS